MLQVVIVFLCLSGTSVGQNTNPTTLTVADVIRIGASFASRFFDGKSTTFLPTSLGKYFKHFQNSGSEDDLLSLLRLFGVNNKRIQEWAFRGLVSLLPLMNQVFSEKERKKRQKRSPRGFSILRFIVQSPQVADILSHMRNPDLIDQLLKESEDKLDADCVKLLICKTKPVVRGMQNSLRFFLQLEKMEACDSECSKVEDAWKKASLEDRMYFFLPSMSEVIAFGDECDKQYPGCEY